MAAATETRATELFKTVSPYLQELLTKAPNYGNVGLVVVFFEGDITRIDVSASVQRRVAPRAIREGGAR